MLPNKEKASRASTDTSDSRKCSAPEDTEVAGRGVAKLEEARCSGSCAGMELLLPLFEQEVLKRGERLLELEDLGLGLGLLPEFMVNLTPAQQTVLAPVELTISHTRR